jgi:hypothetical protein
MRATFDTTARLRVTGVCFLILQWGFDVRPALAQVLYGSVIGTVTDQSESVVPGAVVTLSNRSTGASKEMLTDDGGRYSLVNLLPGDMN